MVSKATILTLGLLALTNGSFSLRCRPCKDVDCGASPTCSFGLTKDVCGCCDACAKGPEEACGGPWGISGRCSVGLECQQDTNIPGQHPQRIGTCVEISEIELRSVTGEVPCSRRRMGGRSRSRSRGGRTHRVCRNRQRQQHQQEQQQNP